MSFTKYLLFIALAFTCGMILIKNFSYWRSQPCSINNSFVVGTAAGYAPYVSINAQGEYEGFDIDVAREVARTMGKELVLKDLGSMTSLMMALEQGSIDAIIWGVSITQARQQKFSLIHYQGNPTTSYPLIMLGDTWKNNIPTGPLNFQSLSGMTICAEPSSSQYDVLKQYPNISILPTDKVDDALMHLQHGTAQAALLDPAIAKKFKTKFPELVIINMPLPEHDQVHGIGIVLKKDSTQLQESVQRAVDTLKKEGIIAHLETKWGLA